MRRSGDQQSQVWTKHVGLRRLLRTLSWMTGAKQACVNSMVELKRGCVGLEGGSLEASRECSGLPYRRCVRVHGSLRVLFPVCFGELGWATGAT